MTESQEPMILQVNRLSASFGEKDRENKVLQDVSYRLLKGECLGIVGESGSGKTLSTLASIGLLPISAKVKVKGISYFPEETEVILHDKPESEIRRYRGKEIAVIFQEPLSSLNPSMKCGKQITEMIDLHLDFSSVEARKEAIDLLGKVQLKDPGRVFNSYPHQLSGGQLQRVMIAMAISCRPKVLIADEPTTALDVTVQKEVLQLLKSLQKEYNMAMMFISHDLAVIAQVADRMIVMKDGLIVEEGSKDDVLYRPQHPYTQALIACRPDLHSDSDRLPVLDKDGVLIVPDSSTKKEPSPQNWQEEILNVENLSVVYGQKKNILGKISEEGFPAVKDVSFSIRKGEILGLVGESGSGKSSIAKTLVRLVDRQSGKISFQSERIDELSDKDFVPYRKKIQMIFQDPYSSLNPRMKIGKAIEEPLIVHKLARNAANRRDRVDNLLVQVGLSTDTYDRYPHEFSGGQRQRICIARALACSPEVLICDESVSALDISIQGQILNLLLDIRSSMGLTMLFISHDLSVVRYISDRIIVLNKGEIVEEATADDLFANPQNDYTKNLISSVLTF